MPPIHMLIKPASGHCNLRCKYCFYYDEMKNREIDNFGMMTKETLEEVIKKGLDYSEDEITIAYQGGEPTLIGLDFFKYSIELQKKYNHKNLIIHNAIQTNGFAITREWAEFFKENNFLVGVSVDGVKKTHDAFRKTPAGEDSFNKIMETTRLFKEVGVEFNILTVVNKKTAKNIEEIYKFYRRNSFDYLQFVPCLNPFGQEDVDYDYTLSAKEYGIFLSKLFDLWYDEFTSGGHVSIRHFENFVEMLMGYPPESCGMSGICSFQNVIEADGQVYPCDFYALDQYKLGNLSDINTTFTDVFAKRRETKFVEESTEFPDECRKCKYFFICRGGCKRYREPKVNGKFRVNCLCEGQKIFFNHALPRLQGLARELLRRNGGR